MSDSKKTTVEAHADDGLVEIRLPKAWDGEDPEVFVGVNGQGWRIQKGKTVKVPASVAEVLRNAERAEDEADAYIAANAGSAEPK